MKPIWRLLIAVVVLAGVVAILYWPQKPVVVPKTVPLVSFHEDAVQQLKISQPGQPDVVLSRQDGVWELDQPYKYPADGATVATVLDDVANIDNPQSVGQVTDPAQFGLDHPSTVEVKLTSGKTYDFEFGSDTPTGGNTYLRLGDNGPVEIADTAIKESALKSAFLLQDKTPVHFPAGKVTSIAIIHDDKPLKFAKTDNAWPTARRSQIQDMLDGLSDGEMSAMIDPTGKTAGQHGLRIPTTTLTLLWNGGSAQLDVGAAEDTTDDYARNSSSPAVFTIPSYLVSDITALYKPVPAGSGSDTSSTTPSAVSGSTP